MLKSKSLTLLLNTKEYIEAWEAIIEDFYKRIISDDAIYLPLELEGEKAYQFSFELATVLLVIVLRCIKPSGLYKGAKEKVEELVVEEVYKNLIGNSQETIDMGKKYYQKQYAMFDELIHQDAKDKRQQTQQMHTEFTGYARYLISTVTSKPEHQYKDVIKNISVYLIEEGTVFAKLVNNTAVDGNSIVFKNYKFLVKQ